MGDGVKTVLSYIAIAVASVFIALMLGMFGAMLFTY